MIQQPTPTMFVGIDPGASGGIAVMCGSSIQATTMPRSLRHLWEYIYQYIGINPQIVVGGMEQVGGYIEKGGSSCPRCHQPKNRQPGSSMFNFGKNVGNIEMALIGCGLEMTKAKPKKGHCYLVPPQEWQRGLGIDPKRKSETDSEYKARLKWNAEEMYPKNLYPGLRVTLRTCDALLIVAYTKKLYARGY